MADKDLKITAGLEPGAAEDIAKGADKALSPWEKKAKSVGREIKSAFQGAVTDMTRAVTVGNAITFAHAIESARAYRRELGILSSTAGPVAQLRYQIGALSQQKLIREQDLVAADRGLGRMVYSTKGALSALGALADQAQATSETLADKLPLGATLMASMGVSGAKMADELGRVRAIADQLGTTGGLLAAEDRLTGMRDLLDEIGTATDKDRAKLEALALGLGNKGLSAGAGSRAAAAIIGSVSGRRETFEALGGMKLGSLTDEDGNLRVGGALDAAQKAQAWVRRQSKSRAMQQMIATSLVGGDRHAGAALLNADFNKIRGAAGAGASGQTAAEAAAYRSSDAGRYEGSLQQMERSARQTAEGLLPVADRAQGLLAAHPFAGGAALGVAGNLAGAGAGAAAGKMAETLLGGGRALASGGVTAGAAVASGGAAAGASLRTATGGLGGLLSKLGLVAGAGAAGYAAGTAADEYLGLSDSIESDLLSGGAGGRKLGDDVATSAQVNATRAKRRAKADKILALADKVNSNNPDVSAPAAQDTRGEAGGDVGLQRLAAAARTGTLDTSGLNPATVAMLTAAIKEGFRTIKIENHSESPIAVNQQQAASGVKN